MLLRGTQESDFKSSLNWNVDGSKVNSGFRFNKLLLHSSLLTVWPETIPANPSKLSPTTLWHLASNWLTLRELRASLRAPSREEQSAFEGNIFLGFGLDPFAKFFISTRFGGGREHPRHLWCFYCVLGTSCLPSLSRKAEIAEWRQHKASATQKTNFTHSASASTSMEKVKHFLGGEGQMQNKQLQMRSKSKRKNRRLKLSPSLGHKLQQYFFHFRPT